MRIDTPVPDAWQKMAVAAGMPRRRILCATDLTPRSERAMQRAALLAREMDADAYFVHALNDRLAGRVLRAKVNRAYVRLASHSLRLMHTLPTASQRKCNSATPWTS